MMAAAQDTVRVTWYLPEKPIYRIKHEALNQRTDFSALVTKILQEYLVNPKEITIQDLQWRDVRMFTVYLPSELWARIKTMASQRNVPVNSLVLSILNENKGRGKIKNV